MASNFDPDANAACSRCPGWSPAGVIAAERSTLQCNDLSRLRRSGVGGACGQGRRRRLREAKGGTFYSWPMAGRLLPARGAGVQLAAGGMGRTVNPGGASSMVVKRAGDQQEGLLVSCICNFASSSVNRNAAGDNKNQGFWVNGRF